MRNNNQVNTLNPITSKRSSRSKETKRAKQKQAEANSRRKVAKSWAYLAAGNKYR